MLAELVIDLNIIRQNAELLKTKCGHIYPVVKADAYGLGAIAVAEKIQDLAEMFFVATIYEAIELKNKLSNIKIATLLGLHADIKLYEKYNIFPVINSVSQLKKARNLSKIIQFDTGMSRNGITYQEFIENDKVLFENTIIIMSHLASSEEKQNDFNNIQLSKFAEIAKNFPNSKKILANSGGAFLDRGFYYDGVRPGIALYGYSDDTDVKASCMLRAKVLEIHNHYKGESVGYNQTYFLDEDKKLATVAIGYADGISRNLSNKASVYINNIPCKILGRVSMDSIVIDITHINNINEGDYVYLFQTKDQMLKIADLSGTIPYNILTAIGKRVVRTYINI